MARAVARVASGVQLPGEAQEPAPEERPTIVFYTDASSYGGAEVVLATLVRELEGQFGLIVAGIDAGVLDRIASGLPGVGVELMPEVSGKFDFGNLVRTYLRIRSLRGNVLHANLRVPGACRHAVFLALFVPSLRVVAVEHLPYPLDGRFQRPLKRFLSKRIDAHLAVGERVARMLEADAKLPPGRIDVVRNGVELLSAAGIGRRSPGFRLGSIGRLVPQKGYDVLLRALADVPRGHLVLAGTGEEADRLRRLATELGLADRIEFTGWSDPAELLAAIDVFVLPSRFEGLPLAILEAMSAGLPVVASRVGSVEEAVRHGTTGLLVPPEDPEALAETLQRLAADPGLRRRLGEQGRRAAVEFSADRMADGYRAIYRRVLR